MNRKKTVIAGGIGSAIGGIGTLISATGFCPCILAPTVTMLGLLSVLTGFLTKYRFIFLGLGLGLLAISLVLHKQHKVCKVHKA